MNSLTIYIDNWCPMCIRFGSLITYLDVLNKISKSDIRIYNDNLICKEKGLKQIASINEKNRIFYGYDSIWQIVIRLPLIWLFIPFFYFLKISGLGNWLYNELSVKRQIIPLHCKDHECKPN